MRFFFFKTHRHIGHIEFLKNYVSYVPMCFKKISNYAFKKYQATSPPHDDPAPAVHPKQC